MLRQGIVRGLRHRDPVNTVLGDESFIRTFGRKPDARTDETLRVRTHLAYVERLLRERPTAHLSEQERQARAAMLDLLRQYWMAGLFPSNTNPAYRGCRRPCFIDESGTICAVGYLIERTAGRDLAESINHHWHNAFVSQMVSPSIEAWMARSGLTIEEFAMIQPGYWGGDDEEDEVRQDLEPKVELEPVHRKQLTLEQLDERIKLFKRVHEEALLRSDLRFAISVRIKLIELKEERERIVAKATATEP